MNYKKIYDDIIIRAKNRVYIKGYGEIHHIVPRCMGGGDDIDNLVKLSPEEHFVCHQLLVKIYPKNYGLIKALNLMCVGVEDGIGKNNRSGNKKYGWIKRKLTKITEYCCEYCDTKYYKVPSLAKRKRGMFCSSFCRTEGYKKLYKCKGCDKEYYQTPSSSTLYCSKECRITPRPVERICNGCGGSYYGVPSSKKTHCSLKCHYDKKHPKKISRCETCSTEFETRTKSKKKFCSHLCREKSWKKSTTIIILCEYCLKLFNSYNSQRNRKFCSKECSTKRMSVSTELVDTLQRY
jgi:hypothetical protein